MVRRYVLLFLAIAVFCGGCYSQRPKPMTKDRMLSVGCDSSGLPVRLDRGDWLVNRRNTIWKVMIQEPNAPSRHIGYLVRTQYRQARGGPDYDVYNVTTLNRREKIGRIDQLGRAYRYEPRRNAGFEEIDEGVGSLQDSVGAIFQTQFGIDLIETSERGIAFELLDKNGNGYLEKEEVAAMGDRIPAADTNGDGRIDFSEFDAIDQL